MSSRYREDTGTKGGGDNHPDHEVGGPQILEFLKSAPAHFCILHSVRSVTMGVRLELSPHVIALMNNDDQVRYGGATRVTVPSDHDTRVTSRKRDADERREQGTFASWLQLQNSNGRKIPFVHHAMHRASRASVGCPDFYVGINGRSLWFEFKRDESCKLTPEQEEFRLACEAQRIEHHVVCSAAAAIAIVQR